MTATHPTTAPFDIDALRRQFPILHQDINGKPLVYFDNAATSQKPQVVLEALAAYYEQYNANIHRGLHNLADRATAAYEDSRKHVRDFIHAEDEKQIIFTRGCTEGINLVSNSLQRMGWFREGDEILLSGMEHHSNIVPWQFVAEQTGAKIRVMPVKENGALDLDQLDGLLSERTRMVSVVHVSNALGTVNPVEEITRRAHEVGAAVLIDGAQAIPHTRVDVQDIDADFYVFSGHKVYGPTGIGVLYGKTNWLEAMPPYQGGGEMIDEVSFEKTTYNALPYKFEAGTPNIADAIALKTALEFVENLGYEAIQQQEDRLLKHGRKRLSEIEGLRFVGDAPGKASVISFVIEGAHHQDIGILLDQQGIAVRTGHHCTQPLMKSFGLAGTARASFAVYNTTEEIDRLADGLHKILPMLQ